MRAEEEDAEEEDKGKEEAEENKREVEEEEGSWAAASPAPPLSLLCCIENVARPAVSNSFLQYLSAEGQSKFFSPISKNSFGCSRLTKPCKANALTCSS